MAKTIKFVDDGIEYTLEFSREVIQEMEKKGFNIQEIESKPMTMFPMLVEGAFKMHHKFVGKEQIQRLYESLPNKNLLIEKLGEMYAEAFDALTGEPTDEKNLIKWEANW